MPHSMKSARTFCPGYTEATPLMEPPCLSERPTGGHAPGLMEKGDSIPLQSQLKGQYPLLDIIPILHRNSGRNPLLSSARSTVKCN